MKGVRKVAQQLSVRDLYLAKHADMLTERKLSDKPGVYAWRVQEVSDANKVRKRIASMRLREGYKEAVAWERWLRECPRTTNDMMV